MSAKFLTLSVLLAATLVSTTVFSQDLDSAYSNKLKKNNIPHKQESGSTATVNHFSSAKCNNATTNSIDSYICCTGVAMPYWTTSPTGSCSDEGYSSGGAACPETTLVNGGTTTLQSTYGISDPYNDSTCQFFV